MKRYYKEEAGQKVWLGNILNYEGQQIINPTEEQILSAGYIEYTSTALELSEEQILENLKKGIKAQILTYDKSENVDGCFIVYNGVTLPYWADKYERNDLKQSLRDCLSQNITSYRLDLRDVGLSITLDCDKFLEMLSLLEIYAIQCYNKTTDHLFAIDSLTTMDDVASYDFTQGYPEKLTFEL